MGERSERSLQERSRIFKAPPNFSMLRMHLSPESMICLVEKIFVRRSKLDERIRVIPIKCSVSCGVQSLVNAKRIAKAAQKSHKHVSKLKKGVQLIRITN